MTDYETVCRLELARLQETLQARRSVWGWLWLNSGAIAAVVAVGLVLVALWETFKP